MTSIAAAIAMGITTPRPEHPRPDMFRPAWTSLNGEWEFAESNDPTQPASFPDKIIVPFARESKLSGLGRTGFIKNVWYRRTFTVPKEMAGKRVRLHIGASDWRTTIWVNGSQVREHIGGSSQITAEVTQVLKPGSNTVLIHAFDDSASGLQPLGKQSRIEKSEGIFYTRTTGIWQSVWLEAVGSTYVRQTAVEPDLPGKRFLVAVETEGPAAGRTVKATLKADGQVVATAEAPAGGAPTRLILKPKIVKLWEPGKPFLYDLTYEIMEGRKVIDKVESQTGLRSVETDGRSILINGKRVFQRLILDQGFYPDGIWTAPSDEALKKDIELSMAAGFNGARLHQKVFEPRFLYWADKLGYMVWGEYPSYGMDYGDPRVNRPVAEEWANLVERDRNHPSIIGWCPFNETADDAVPMQNMVTRMTWALDRTRPTIDTSGWVHGLPEARLSDAHDYDDQPARLHQRWMMALGAMQSELPSRYRSESANEIPFFISEFGGIGYNVKGGWGYGGTPKTEEEFFTRLRGTVVALLDNPNLFGFCYTQLTDVEQEHNGLYNYDRVAKFPAAKFKEIFTLPSAYEQKGPVVSGKDPIYKVLVHSVKDNPQPWEYTFNQPSEGWQTRSGEGWKSSIGGFGSSDYKNVKTAWKTDDIWIRQTFNYDGAEFKKALLAIYFDNQAKVYVNGALVWAAEPGTWNYGYDAMNITAALKKALKKGSNTIAVHVHQDSGGQFIDLALLVE
jgi:hypothetical protein